MDIVVTLETKPAFEYTQSLASARVTQDDVRKCINDALLMAPDAYRGYVCVGSPKHRRDADFTFWRNGNGIALTPKLIKQ